MAARNFLLFRDFAFIGAGIDLIASGIDGSLHIFLLKNGEGEIEKRR